MKIPRKKKKQIPKDTPYCYTALEMLDDGGMLIKSCPFYEHVDGIEGKCRLLKCEIEDQIKSCGTKKGY